MGSTGMQLQKNIDAAGVLSGLLTLYRSLKRYFNNALGLIFVITIIAPLLYLFLLLFRRSLRKKYSGDIVINKDNYVNYRNLYHNSSEAIKSINIADVSKADISKVPWYIRYVVRQFLHTYTTIIDSHNQLGKALKSIDDNAPKSNFFTLRTESDLWDSRNKAYEYLR